MVTVHPLGKASGQSAATGTAAPAGKNHEDPGVRAAVREYFAKLETELRGRQHHNGPWDWWSAAGPERDRRHHYARISARLIAQGLPYLRSNPPAPGASPELRGAIEAYLHNHPEVFTWMEAAVFRPEPLHDFSGRDLLPCQVEPPFALGDDDGNDELVAGANFLAGEQRNRSLARAGEHFVLAFERQRLRTLGLTTYAEAIEHTAVELGDNAGYDVQSWQVDGSPLLIRVKTTRYGGQTPFYLSVNELAMARAHAGQYTIYRVFDFPSSPRLFCLDGPLDERCTLHPTAYRATPA